MGLAFVCYVLFIRRAASSLDAGKIFIMTVSFLSKNGKSIFLEN